MPPRPSVRYEDFCPQPGIPREEYLDWLNIAESDDIQAALDIEAGNVPEGMILSWRGCLWSVWSWEPRLRRYA